MHSQCYHQLCRIQFWGRSNNGILLSQAHAVEQFVGGDRYHGHLVEAKGSICQANSTLNSAKLENTLTPT